MSQQPSSLTSALLSLLAIILVLGYPFMVHQYINEINPRWFAGILFGVFIIRFLIAGNTKKNSDRLMLGVVSTFCLCIAIFESAQLLTFYPVLMSTGMGLLFITSLFDKQCLIARFAELGGKTPPVEAHNYLRTLTLLWGLLLITNAAISAYTACYTDLLVWTLYNGLISYLIFACFATGEWFYRGHYKRIHNITDDD